VVVGVVVGVGGAAGRQLDNTKTRPAISPRTTDRRITASSLLYLRRMKQGLCHTCKGPSPHMPACRHEPACHAAKSSPPRFPILGNRNLSPYAAARDKAGLTQGEVAQQLGADASFVSKVESGERRLDVVELAALCRIYQISLIAFLRETGFDDGA
jgi:DNA-binding XRE family transcriptional regulator